MSEIKTVLPGGMPAALAQSGIANARAESTKASLKKGISSEKELDKAASGFEALLLHNMLKEMWESVDSGGALLGEDSNASQIYRDMFHQTIADKIAEGKGMGVKEFLKRELHKYQDASKK